MNPTALLKLAAAILPLTGDEKFGQQMLAEIKYLFDAIGRIDKAIVAMEESKIPIVNPNSWRAVPHPAPGA